MFFTIIISNYKYFYLFNMILTVDKSNVACGCVYVNKKNTYYLREHSQCPIARSSCLS